MNNVEANFQGIVAANGAGDGFGGIGRAHRGADNADGFGAFQHTNDDRAGGDVFHQTGVEGFAFVDAVVLFRQFWRDLNELEAHKLESALLKARDNVADESALDAFGFDNNECLFHSVAKCSLYVRSLLPVA